jgi:hypothetical protein
MYFMALGILLFKFRKTIHPKHPKQKHQSVNDQGKNNGMQNFPPPRVMVQPNDQNGNTH